ncbi:MAG: hypothetical protein COS94_07345 [Candidatus Hydrogenedentes bacterium CG07_land_8_20_14_0_80_42_17]|nr:MAG: hypothetical protein COS94_07345 [Candidatus Hydrogenedentes bacterium CG07_land_8_20_14_0_80_42_17]
MAERETDAHCEEHGFERETAEHHGTNFKAGVKAQGTRSSVRIKSVGGKNMVQRLGISLAIIAILLIFAPANISAESNGVSSGSPTAGLLRVAVLDFENKVPAGQNDIGWGMAEMLIRELKKTGRYQVLERAALAEILGEQDFTQSGRVQRGQQLAIGKVKGAQVLIKGAITEFSYDVQDRNFGLGYRGIGIGFTEAKARVAADIRLIDAMTGEIIETMDEAADVKATGAQLAGTVNDFSFSAGGNNNHPLGQAVRQLIDRMVNRISNRLDTKTIEVMMTQNFEGSVVKVNEDKTIVINRGFSDGVKTGERLNVNRIIETLIDPETNEVLGTEKTAIGIIEITNVEEKWSKAIIVSGSGFQRGDNVTR